MVKLQDVEVFDVTYYAGTTFSFDLKFWLDDDKTEPEDVISFQCSIRAGSTELLDLDEYAIVDDEEANVVHVSVPPEASEDLATQEAKWVGIVNFASGETRPVYAGVVHIKGRKVD